MSDALLVGVLVVVALIAIVELHAWLGRDDDSWPWGRA